MGKKSKKAFTQKLSPQKKDKVLKDYYHLIIKNKKLIIDQNKKDIKVAKKKKIKNNLIQRLILDDKKISNIIGSIKKIIKLMTSHLPMEVISLWIIYLKVKYART